MRVLILQNQISDYRVAVYNRIAESVDLTLGFFEKDKSKGRVLFKRHHFETNSVGPFIFIRGLRSFCRQFDVVCIMPNLRVFSYCILPFFKHQYKIISWGIGFRCSYQHPYLPTRAHTFMDSIYQLVLSKCDANIFYMEESKQFWHGTKLRMDNVFVAANTTEVKHIDFMPEEKRNFLFVGTLYRGKGLDLLLDAFKSFKNNNQSDIKLVIVGGGEMESELKDYVYANNLCDDVNFTGPIYDELELSKHFAKSLICISPTQAGLSVPKSMGYGVPFVTRKDAITGGEIYHIINQENGILYSNNSELAAIMADANRNRGKYIEMGKKAKDYYDSCATIDKMAEGALNAIYYGI